MLVLSIHSYIDNYYFEIMYTCMICFTAIWRVSNPWVTIIKPFSKQSLKSQVEAKRAKTSTSSAFTIASYQTFKTLS